MDKELDIHHLMIKMRQLKALIKDDSIVNFELRDRLSKLKKLKISTESQDKKELSDLDKVERISKLKQLTNFP